MGPKSRVPNSNSRYRASFSPRFWAISRAPVDTKWTDGNLSVTIAMLWGALGEAASASNRRFGNVRPGSGPSAHAGNWRSYFARCGIPNVWCTSSLS
jgi:hypothetical protein